MPSADFLRDASIRLLRKANERMASRGKAAGARPEDRVKVVGEGAVAFQVELGEEKRLDVVIMDMSERLRLIEGDGFKVLIPIPNLAIRDEGGEFASFLNKLNSRDDKVGKFVILKDKICEFIVIEDLLLAFALETLVPKANPDPELVEVATLSALETAVEFYIKFEEAAGPSDDSDPADWDISDILNA